MTPQAAAINRKELFLRACRGEVLPRVPVWMMRQAGRYLPEYREIRAKHAFLEVCKTPQLAVEVSIQPFRRLGVDAVIVFSDILIPAEAMGLQLELGDAGPNLPNPVRSKADVDRLKMFDPETETGFLPEAIRRIVKSVGPDVPVLGFAGAPWTLACYMVEGKTKEGFATVKSFPARRGALLRERAQRRLAHGFSRNSTDAGSKNRVTGQCRSGCLVWPARENTRSDAGRHQFSRWPRSHPQPRPRHFAAYAGRECPAIYRDRPGSAASACKTCCAGALGDTKHDPRTSNPGANARGASFRPGIPPQIHSSGAPLHKLSHAPSL